MYKIVVLTTTRADYGILRPLIKKMKQSTSFQTYVVATGMHLSPDFGMTVKEIETDGICVDERIDILLDSDSPAAQSKTMGVAMISFADYFEKLSPDALVVLGDRYETLAVCCVAMNARIPIFHIHGGEITEGAIDEMIRHCISKMSYLHFTCTDVYRRRVIQLGEQPDRVYNVGALGIENAIHMDTMSRAELEASLGFSLGDKYAVGTFHPVSLESQSIEEQLEELFYVVKRKDDITFLFTKANSDVDGKKINARLKRYSEELNNVILVDSLGSFRYFSALKNALFVIGNSSSGIIEAPYFGVPTINIGDRQKGRVMGDTIISCRANRNEIEKAIDTALSHGFYDNRNKSKQIYGDGNTSEKIVKIMTDYLVNGRINLKKKFYDI